MRVIRQFMLCALFAVCCFGISFAQVTTSPDNEKSLGDVARQYRQQKQTNSASGQVMVRPFQTQVSYAAEVEQENYKSQMGSMLRRNDFDALEKEANTVRRSKSRFLGGVWKLYVFYEGVEGPVGGKLASDGEWEAHIEALKNWGALKPDSSPAGNLPSATTRWAGVPA